MRKKFVLLALVSALLLSLVFGVQFVIPVGANPISYPSIAMPCEHIEAKISLIEEEPSVASITHPCMITIFEVKLDVNMTFNIGTNLTIRFYSYSGTYQGETTVWSGTTPAHVDLSINVSHPLDRGLQPYERAPVENATLVLTDDNGTIISSITTFVMTRRHLFERILYLDMRWTFPWRDWRITQEIFVELVCIDGQWPYAPR